MSKTQSTIARPADDHLLRLYVDQRLGCPEIAKLYERDPKTVYYWLKRAGIPTRPRGSDPAQWFARGGDPRSFSGTKHSAASRALIAIGSKGRKPYLRGGMHWLHTVPADQNPNWKGGITPERQEFYRTPEWKAAAKAVWRREDACCQRCALDWRTVDRASTPIFHIHHVISFAVREQRAVVSNLVLLCQVCHRWVHSDENASQLYLASEWPRAEVGMPTLFDLAALDAEQEN